MLVEDHVRDLAVDSEIVDEHGNRVQASILEMIQPRAQQEWDGEEDFPPSR
jgi:hypothetical protein